MYPVRESITETTFASDTTAHAVNMPATVNAGELLVVVFTNDGSATVTTPSGWTQLYTSASGSALRGSVYGKVAAGTEDSTTVDFVTSANEAAAAQCYRISGWYGAIAGLEAGTAGAVTTGSTADPPSLTASWGSDENLWLAICHTSTSQTVSSGPTSYTDLTQTSSGAATTHAQAISAVRENTTATEDPGVFTMSGAGATKIYNTLVIRPIDYGEATITVTNAASGTFNAAAVAHVSVMPAGAVSNSFSPGSVQTTTITLSCSSSSSISGIDADSGEVVENRTISITGSTAITLDALKLESTNFANSASSALVLDSISFLLRDTSISNVSTAAFFGSNIVTRAFSVTDIGVLNVSLSGVESRSFSITCLSSADFLEVAFLERSFTLLGNTAAVMSGIATTDELIENRTIALTGASSLLINAEGIPSIFRHIFVPPIPGIGHEIWGVLASPQAQEVYRQAFIDGDPLLTAAAGETRADTGYPFVESVTPSMFTANSVDHAVLMPAMVNVGDGLLVIFTNDGDATITTPGGWDKLYSSSSETSVRGSAYALVSDGTEGGTTVNFITDAAEKASAQVYRITNWNGTLAGIQNSAVGTNASGTTADLPALTTYWGSSKMLVIGCLHTSTSQTVASAPSGYTGLVQTASGATTTDAQCVSAVSFTDASSEDPGVFTMSGSGAAKVYNTIAIAPAYVGLYYEHFEVTRESITLWQGLYSTQLHNVPDPNITRAVIVVHGKSLDAAEYGNVVARNMVNYLGKVIVLAPFYERNVESAATDQLFWGSSWPQLGRSSTLLPWRISSGEILDLLISELYVTFENLEGVIITGHSAGGQFTNRYSSASADSRNRYLVSAPSSYVYPGSERTDGAGGWSIPLGVPGYDDWKFGLQNLSTVSYVDAIGEATLRNRLEVAKVHYMVGENDDDPASSSLDLTPAAELQGSQRVERQRLYHDYLSYFYYGVYAREVRISNQAELTAFPSIIEATFLTFSSIADLSISAAMVEPGEFLITNLTFVDLIGSPIFLENREIALAGFSELIIDNLSFSSTSFNIFLRSNDETSSDLQTGTIVAIYDIQSLLAKYEITSMTVVYEDPKVVAIFESDLLNTVYEATELKATYNIYTIKATVND